MNTEANPTISSTPFAIRDWDRNDETIGCNDSGGNVADWVG